MAGFVNYVPDSNAFQNLLHTKGKKTFHPIQKGEGSTGTTHTQQALERAKSDLKRQMQESPITAGPGINSVVTTNTSHKRKRTGRVQKVGKKTSRKSKSNKKKNKKTKKKKKTTKKKKTNTNNRKYARK